jgi:DNA invertase Pin-like site-specific DNA recombinase
MTEKPQGSKGVAYIRVSDGENQKPESQREMIRRKLLSWGLTVQHWYEDIDGRNPRDCAEKRQEFQRLLSDVQAGKVDWIIVDSQDRWGTKDNFEFGFYAHQLRMNDCHLWSVQQGCLTSGDAAAVFTSTVGAVTSTAEQKERGRRTIRGKITLSQNGEWQGGYTPYGFDVACVDPAGKEVWRVVIEKTIPTENLWQRVRIYPDGRQERWDGKGMFPTRDKGYRLLLVPSCRKERIKIAKEIFTTFAQASWTQRALCQSLNERHVDPVYGHGWYASRLGPLLRNPVYYFGATVWNKKSHGRYRQFCNGEIATVERIKGRIKTGRKNQRTDWIEPTNGNGHGIIDKETWDAVQRKLEASPASPKAVRSPELYLAGLVFCVGCGGKMVGWKQAGLSYTCPTYRKYGTAHANRSKCRLNRAHHVVLEECLVKFLEEAQEGIRLMLASQNDPAPLYRWMESRAGQVTDILERMGRYIETNGRKGFLKGKRISSEPYEGLKQIYDAVFATEKEAVTKALRQKEKELSALVERFASLPSTATTALLLASKKIQAHDDEVKSLKLALVPLSQKLDEQLAQLEEFRRTVERAIEVAKKNQLRYKAEAIRKVVERIDCYFEPWEMGQLHAARLVKVEISPFVGKPFFVSIPPEQG